MERCEVAIVGAGVAGLSLAWALAERGVGGVVVLEQEGRHAYHASGRSAACLVELDVNPTVRALKIGAAALFRALPASLGGTPLLDRRGVLLLFRGDEWRFMEAAAAPFREEGIALSLLTPTEAAARVPVIDPSAADGALFLPEDGFLDIDRMLERYLAAAKAAGAHVRTGQTVRGVRVEGGRARAVVTDDGPLEAEWIVCAAGAWASQLAALAGAAELPLVPRRRTLVELPAPDLPGAAEWPLVAFESDDLYFRPRGDALVASPMDEIHSGPCDAGTDDATVEDALAKLRRLAPGLPAARPRRAWAGLRTFSPDEAPVVGEDPRVERFFWLAGQGGAGLETSPFLARIAADLLLEGRTGLFDPARLSPERFG